MNQKFAFIICVNNEIFFKECSYYINRLSIPSGYEIDIIAIRDAASICSAYNKAMTHSDAKYKIYLHQDVFIRNTSFLQNILDIFQHNSDIGMIGMVGGNQMPASGVAYMSWNEGSVDCREPDMAYYLNCNPSAREDKYVEAIDGLIIITQYDTPWRDDLFQHFDFYDVSQSFEIRKMGYKILVPYQEIPWVIHDSGFVKLKHYDGDRQICLQEYPAYFYAEDGFTYSYNAEWDKLSDMLAAEIRLLMEKGFWNEVAEIIHSYRNGIQKSADLETLGIFSDIVENEKKADVVYSFFSGCVKYQDIFERYTKVKFLFRRIELNFEPQTYSELEQAIRNHELSYEAVSIFVIRCTTNRKHLLEKLYTFYAESEQLMNAAKIQEIYEFIKNKEIPVVTTKRMQL